LDWIEQGIAIGNYLEAKDKELLGREGIKSVLSLDGTLAGESPDSLGLQAIEVVRLNDGPGNDKRLMILAVTCLAKLVVEAPPVLVQCHAGRSRSIVVVAGYIMRRNGLSLEEALKHVCSRRESSISLGLIEFLEDWA
jgi:protein-tyrosine phosphatase